MNERICPPFANYPRAKLERLVHEGFEQIEREAHDLAQRSQFFPPERAPISHFDFQVLVAADFFLRTTKG